MLSFMSPLGYLFGMAIVLGTAWIVSRIPVFSRDLDEQGPRLEALDGLRGLLATAVVFHHVVIFRAWQETEVWEPPVPGLYRQLGPIAVAMFFMLTGFLFWTKAINQSGQIPAWSLLRGRVRRIAPLFTLLAVLLLLASLAESRLILQTSPSELARQVITVFSMGIRDPIGINGTNAAVLGGSMIWTLTYEWKFYAVLPLMAPLTVLKKHGLWLILIPYILFGVEWHFSLFGLGMAAACIARNARWRAALSSRWATAVMLVAILGGALTLKGASVVVISIIVFGLFLPISCGNDVFGFLRLRPLRALGEISFSIYLLHCILLYTVYRGAGPAILALSPVQFWGLMGGLAAGIVGISACTYHFIERPFLRKTSPPSQPSVASATAE
jgi:peptidoglycan/LPS O-acetylase OafA/YrhL